MKKFLPYIIVILISMSASVGVSYLLLSPRKNKTAFVQLGKVYNDFELTKKLDAQLKQTATIRKNYIDSLEFQVKSIYTRVSNNQADKMLQSEFESAQRHYAYQKEQYEESVGAMEEQYNQQIWKQLNEYVTEYGKEHGYTYIFGAEGSGTIMYGNEAADLTIEITKYVNDKYQGK